MTPDVVRPVPEVGSPTGLPVPADVADTWLAHALAQLFDAYRLPEATRGELVASGSYPGEVGEPVPEAAGDTSRLAVEFAALALEARLNRILETCDPADWSAGRASRAAREASHRTAPARPPRAVPLTDRVGGYVLRPPAD